MTEEQTFAYDDYAQQVADEIEIFQGRAKAELELMKSTKSPRLKVGNALQHAINQEKADQKRAELLAYVRGDSGGRE